MWLSQILAVLYVLSGRTLNWLYVRKQSQKSNNPIALNFVLFLMALVVGALAILFLGTTAFVPKPYTIIMLVIAGFFYVIANNLKFEALKRIDLSAVTLISQLSLLAGTLTPFLIGTAKYNHLLGLGILLVFLGNCLIVFNKKLLAKFSLDKYIVYSIVAAFALGWAGVVYDLIKNEISLLLAFVIYGAIEIIMMMFSKQVSVKNVAEEITIHGKVLLPMALFWFASGTSILVAIKYLGIILGTIVVNVSVVTIVMSGIIFLNERQDLLRKLLATIVVFAGTLLVVINR